MKRRLDLRDRDTLTILALGVPVLIALAVLAWGFSVTDRGTAIPDPKVSPIVAVDPKGAVVPIAPTQPPATPTPTLGPGTAYRVEGVIVDELGAPVQGVCIAIGPNGCQDHSPRTDARGVYFIDFPKAEVDYDLHFAKAGYPEIIQRLRPTNNQILNLVLAR